MVTGHYPIAFVPARVAFADLLHSLFDVERPPYWLEVAFTLIFFGGSLGTALVVGGPRAAGSGNDTMTAARRLHLRNPHARQHVQKLAVVPFAFPPAHCCIGSDRSRSCHAPNPIRRSPI